MNKLSLTKDRYFPKFYKEQAPRIIDFMGYYLEWMNDTNNPYWNIDHLTDITNIDSSIDSYVDHLKNELMKDFPIDYVGDLKYIMKNLILLYQSKGAVASLQFFFRAAYNSFCKITYPKEFILKTSDGKWSQGYYLYTEDIPINKLTEYQNKTIKGLTSGTVGVISDIIPHYFENDQTLYYCFSIIDNVKSFTLNESIKILDTNPSVTFTLNKAEYTKGYWTGTDGFLDSDMKLQDSFYYQNFSYEITSLISLSEYQDIVNLLFNPVGMKMFGNVQLYETTVEYPKEITSMLHWLIIKIFMGLYAITKSMAYEINIKHHAWGYSLPFSPDIQLYNKLYGSIKHYKDISPIKLMTWTNDSSKIIFNNDGTLNTNVNWNDELLITNEYYILNIESECPKYVTSVSNGIITVPSHLLNKNPIIFVNNKKVVDSMISIINNGYKLLSNDISNNVVLYFPKSHIVKYLVNNYSKDDLISISKWSDSKAVFLNGKLINDYIKDDKIIMPESGTLEIFLYEQYDYLECNKYIKYSNKLLMKNPLRLKYM